MEDVEVYSQGSGPMQMPIVVNEWLVVVAGAVEDVTGVTLDQVGVVDVVVGLMDVVMIVVQAALVVVGAADEVVGAALEEVDHAEVVELVEALPITVVEGWATDEVVVGMIEEVTMVVHGTLVVVGAADQVTMLVVGIVEDATIVVHGTLVVVGAADQVLEISLEEADHTAVVALVDALEITVVHG